MPNDVKVDLVGKGGGQGPMANALVSGDLNLGKKRPYLGDDGKQYINVYISGDSKKPTSYREICTNANPFMVNASATLRRDEWKQLDEALIDVSRARLGGVQDLLDKGLTYNLGNAMGTTVLEWHDVSDALSVELTMDGVTRGKNDNLVFQTNYLPIPILHVDYEINARHLEASRKLGNPLDTTLAERAARRILEKQEQMLFTDTTYAFGTKDDRDRNKIYSYVNFPDRNTVSLGTAWDASAKTPAGILNDVLNMKKASIAAYHYGPWMMYICTDYEVVLDDDYDTTTPGKTIRERLLAIDGIQGIKVIDTLPDNTVLLVEMKKETVRLINGFGLTTIAYTEEAGMLNKFKVMAIQVPQIRSDQNGKCGIVHLA
jgi:uncharacterized linocin/CFP29 family protein